YSMLLYTGYLTVADFSTYTEADYLASLRIPNESVRQCFKHNIYDYFTSSPSGTDTSVKMVDAIFNKDAEALGDIISEALNTYISVRDFSCNAKKEYYYHAFLNGRFSCMGHKIVNYSSNGESGDGYADIMFTDTVKKIGVVIELKVSTDGTLAAAADRALSQIEEKNYAGVLETKFCVEKVYCYGIAFKGKSCEVKFIEH
ncbi:MAG: PD-(D/E)XK nuclease domain-containing protein, partial [Succinivibrio sp.]|nr:PD-(D/E)XK nuclease domain-containing protein [Succinivibrio sp.]